MMQQGRCVLPADETGRVLDRLTALEKVISPTDIRQALMETGRVNPRACKLTHEVMMWIVLAMGTLEDVPDTSANDTAFGRPTSGKRGDGAFPQIRKLSLVEVGM